MKKLFLFIVILASLSLPQSRFYKLGILMADDFLPQTNNYKTRVLADGGEIIDLNAVNDFYKNAISGGYYDTLRVWYGHTYGVKKDANNKVTKLYSLIGTEDIVNTDTSKCPTHTLAVKNGLPGGVYDGSNDYLKVTLTGLQQPETIFMVGKLIYTSGSGNFFDGDSYVAMGCYYNAPTSIVLRGSTQTGGVSAVSNTWYILNAIFQGATSRLKLNAGAEPNLNAGTTAGAGLIVGAGAIGGTAASNSTICEFGLSGTRMSDALRTKIRTFLNTKYAVY